MLQIIAAVFIIMIIVAIPLIILKFLGEQDWRLRKIDKKVLKVKNRRDWRDGLQYLGYVLILIGIGSTFADKYPDLPLWSRILCVLLGSFLIAIWFKKPKNLE